MATPVLSQVIISPLAIQFFAQKKLVASITPTAINAPAFKHSSNLIAYPLSPSTKLQLSSNFLSFITTSHSTTDSFNVAIVPNELKEQVSEAISKLPHPL